MLSGEELLSAVKELSEASKPELVRATGYVTRQKDGSERLNFTAFYEALLAAKGLDISGRRGARRGGKRRLTFHTKVQFNGNLMVGKAYTALLGLRPGDDFEIKLGPQQIRLLPLGASAVDPDVEGPMGAHGISHGNARGKPPC
ncbi:AbrB family transcriptional regulator [Cyanobium sp. Morenito 9A2]|uniref:AbrB family transcriptional regulator n=1 Tax=Cyanobium sp. Morenito 9A2 TaxID=2823718 RepID=UPI0020CE9F0F|nr:AbrB family transcriptional regulator [Cyanobium sp. Morenito 9A2]MCP9848742.1 AbrB family transcriptional regulator [Cyanobium sp. Morenito 9A2]